MPALRIDKAAFAFKPLRESSNSRQNASPIITKALAPEDSIQLTANSGADKIKYPDEPSGRVLYRTGGGKAVTSHQWDVYDFVRTIPSGRVTTYKDVCAAVGGSPRSVGNALRNNPFAPYIPCHRVIASNFFIGGFLGEWGPEHKTGTRCNQKLGLLSSEGVEFSKNGRLVDADSFIWRG